MDVILVTIIILGVISVVATVTVGYLLIKGKVSLHNLGRTWSAVEYAILWAILLPVCGIVSLVFFYTAKYGVE